jgi:membrane-bound inhibitor of C-type lysozyme
MVARKGLEEQAVGEKVRAAALAILALGLAGCRDRASIPGEAAVAPPAAGQGPVNPDAGVTVYACVDGQTITAGYPDRRTAIVTYKGHAYTLKLAPSASGARYTGYGLQWWTKGASATIAALKPGEEAATAPGLECSPQGPLAAEPVTRTSYKP